MLQCWSSRVARLVLLALPALSCEGSLRLVVVEQGGSGNLTVAGKGGHTGGAVGVVPSGGTVDEGGTSDVAQGGSAGMSEENGGTAGMPEVPSWEAPALYTASFVPYGFLEQYIEHVDGTGNIGLVDMASAAEREAASFEVIPGLYETMDDAGHRCVSFRAVNKLGTFFRHSGSRIYLNPAENEPLFFADATFCEEPGMADVQAITFRSANYPKRVIHLRNVSELWIDDVPEPITAEFAAEATFYRTTALVETAPPGG